MKYNSAIFIFTILLSAFYSCVIIEEENIEYSRVIALAPADSATVTNQTVTFWWSEIEGATQYEMQVVSPTFSNTLQLWVDTVVTDDKFTFTFSPGTYQWRIKAANGAYETRYTIYNFTIDSTSDLSNQTVLLVYPEENDTTNQTRITFQWSPLLNATDYRFELSEPDFNGTILLDVNLFTDTITYTLDEGSYSWRVRGQSVSSNTVYATRSFTIDTTSPSAPVLNAPDDNAMVSDTVNLQWTRSNDAVADSVFVYPDSTYSVIIVNSKTSQSTYSFTGTIGNSYFWRVKSIDGAGNDSPFSIGRKFTIQ
jgi:hypothetical protein